MHIDKNFIILTVTIFAISISIPNAFAANYQVTINQGDSSNNSCATSQTCFSPNVVTISPGDTVTWTNADTVGHTATSGNPSDTQTGTVFDSSLISAGKTYTSPPFNTPGTYNYFCQVHPWMTGMIVVGGTTTSTQSSDITNLSINPTSGQAPLAVSFDLAISGTMKTTTWNFGDGSPSVTGALSAVHTYQHYGNFIGTVEVDFADGQDSAKSFQISVTQASSQNPLSTPQYPGTQTVTINPGDGSSNSCATSQNCFSPSTIQVSPGTTVTWTNADSVGHTATSGHPSDNQTGTVFDSSLIAAGRSYSFTFQNSGTYPYFCQVHPWMTGEVIVGQGSISSNTQPPPITNSNVVTVDSYQVQYTANGASVSSIQTNPTYDEISITVHVTNPGASLDLTLPRALIDSKQGGNDIPFVTIIDGTLGNSQEKSPTSSERTVSISLSPGNQQIEIIGTYLVSSQNSQTTASTPPYMISNDQVAISNGAANTQGTCSQTSCFNPQVEYIGVGNSVTWTNYDSVGHTATSGNPSDNRTGIIFDSSLISSGKSYTTPSFTVAGTYNYFCQVHPWMRGEIVVGQVGQIPSQSQMTSTQQNMSIADFSNYGLENGEWIKYNMSVNVSAQTQYMQFYLKNLILQAITNAFTESGNIQMNSINDLEYLKVTIDSISQNRLTKTSELKITGQQPLTYDSEGIEPSGTFILAIPTTTKIGDSFQTNTDSSIVPTSLIVKKIMYESVGGQETQAYELFGQKDSVDTNGGASEVNVTAHYERQTGILLDESMDMELGTPVTGIVYAHFGINALELYIPGGSSTQTISNTVSTPTSLEVSTDKSSYSAGDSITATVYIPGSNAGQNVAVSITDPTNTSIVARTISTDNTGTASLQARLPSFAKTGNYQVAATASINGQGLNSSSVFTVQPNSQAIQIVSVQATDQQGNPVTSFTRGANGYVKILLYSPASTPSLVTVNLFDSNSTTIGIGSLKSTLSPGQSEVTLSFPIPKDAAVGATSIYTDTFSDWPSNGGKPLTPESSASVEIQ